MTTIYCLKDPRTMQVRYVGYTSKTLEQRLAWHLKDKDKITKKGKWIAELAAWGSLPIIELLEETINWEAREKYYIQLYGGTSYLLNGHQGGKYF